MTLEDTNDSFRKDGRIILNDWLEIDEKAGDMEFLEASDVLMFSNGIIYASWVSGEETVLTADDGTETKFYDMEAYILLCECRNEEEIQAAIDQWISFETEKYDMGDKKIISCSDKEYSCYELTPLGDSPYIGGVAAFASHDNCALSVELMFGKAPDKDKAEILKEFLNAFHYSSD